jgi:hypothetical protein
MNIVMGFMFGQPIQRSFFLSIVIYSDHFIRAEDTLRRTNQEEGNNSYTLHHILIIVNILNLYLLIHDLFVRFQHHSRYHIIWAGPAQG